MRIGFMMGSGVEGCGHGAAELIERLSFDAVEDLAAVGAHSQKAGLYQFGDVAGGCGLGQGQGSDDVRAAKLPAVGEAAQDLDPRRMGQSFGKVGQADDPGIEGIKLGEGHEHISDVRLTFGKRGVGWAEEMVG
jgi:hypothetical protein